METNDLKCCVIFVVYNLANFQISLLTPELSSIDAIISRISCYMRSKAMKIFNYSDLINNTKSVTFVITNARLFASRIMY